MFAVIIKNLGAGTARTRWPHAPEIVVRWNANDFVVCKTRDLLPDVRRLIVSMIDRDEQFLFRDLELFGQQFPGKTDRISFEIVAKAEVAEHLEKRVVARRIADIVQVIMLTARAHTFLRRSRTHIITFLLSGEQVLELHHARVHKHQSRIIARHQRRAGHHLVISFFTEIQKCVTNVVYAGHGVSR